MPFYLEPFRGEQNMFSPLAFPFFSGQFSGHKGISDITTYEHKNSIIVEAPAPGMDANDIKISYERGVLTIQATKKEEKEDKEKKFFQKSSSSFVYHLTVPGNIDEKVVPKAEISNGLIKVVFAKAKIHEGTKTISVQGKSTKAEAKPIPTHSPQKPKRKK